MAEERKLLTLHPTARTNAQVSFLRSTVSIAVALFLWGCGAVGDRQPSVPLPPPAASSRIPEAPRPPAPRAEEMHRGRASWYGAEHHGRRTASGEPFDVNAMTAAHRTLPFGTWLLVENPSNGRTVRVRVTDRGPTIADRVLDLSRAAARALGVTGRGVFDVRYRIVE